MSIPISSISSLSLPDLVQRSGAASQSGGFGQVLSSAIGTVESLNQNASETVQKFLSGENEELHTTVLATQKAELAFELGMQVRNKVVDAYQEIMKMQM
jgi:flagellar hook-basal body complex protein FliE